MKRAAAIAAQTRQLRYELQELDREQLLDRYVRDCGGSRHTRLSTAALVDGGVWPNAPQVEVYVWRPSDLERIAEVLK